MTERLYYHDSSVVEFDARIVATAEHDGKPGVVLDRTAFYPTSGGQPNDTGRLNGVPVIDVIDGDDKTILHVLGEPLAGGPAVKGVIDWPRRFDHMQQHTGQHVLSAAFERLFKARTVGFHLGAGISTIDLDKELAHEKVVTAELDANRVVWENRPVTIRFASEEEAPKIPLRKDPGRVGALRVIEIEGYDFSACGGTHVSRTGAIGHIEVWTAEKFRGGLRLEFACGERALVAYRRLRDAVTGCIKFVSVPPEALPAALERLQSDSKGLVKMLKGLQERLAGFEAASLARRAEVGQGGRRLVEALDGWDQNGLKALALGVVHDPGYQVALFSTSAPHVAVVARSADQSVDAAAVLRLLMDRFGGRGGGKGDLAQGGGLNGPLADIVAAARDALK